MFASVQKYTAVATQVDRLLKSRNEIEKLTTEIPGFLSIYLLKTPEGMTALTLCKSKERAEEAGRRILALIKDRLPELVTTPPQTTIGEVAFQLSALEAHI